MAIQCEVDNMENAINQITICGQLGTLPEFSHENHGLRFYRFLLDVPRLSGAVDHIPVVAPQSLLNPLDPTAGDTWEITGQIRSHNSRLPGPKLLIFVFARAIQLCQEEPDNQVRLSGAICRLPIYRRTPLGREICDIMLAVPRTYHRSDYLPCILWGKLAREFRDCIPGDCLQLQGRFQSRAYQKSTDAGPEQRVAYEISALTAQRCEEEPSLYEAQ